MGLLIAAALLLGCLALILLPRRDVRGRGLALLRCFFPSWRFFEEIEPGPTLDVCAAEQTGEFGAWRPAWTPSPRSAADLILNPRGNLELAYQSLIDQLASELEDAREELCGSITYQLVQRLVEVESLTPRERALGCRYRFRLVAASSGDRAAQPFESIVHELGET